MNPQPPQIDALYQSYDKNLYRITGEEESDSILDMISADSSANNSSNVQTSSSDLGSGISTATTPQATGSQQAGKKTFTDATDGYFLGIVNGIGVFNIGGASSYIKWDGTTLSVVGGFSVSQIDIPDTTTANSFHTDTTGNSWWGANVATGLAGANASVTSAGVAVFKSVTLSASVAISGIANNSSTDISLLEYTHNLVFSVTNATKVAWASGTITMSNGRTFSISSGDTGTMAAQTYIYLDTGASVTVLQVTTTASTAMGANKILIAIAQNGSGQPTYQVYGGAGGLKVNSSGVNIANNNWSYSGAFTVASATQINWASGTLKTSDGTSYSISGSNTGTMAAKTYIYFDLGVSSTAFQITTTATTAIGDGKVLIAVAQNNTTEAVFNLLNNNSQNIDGSNIVTGSLTANEIAAGTITAAKLNVSQLSAIAADLGSITAGSITINGGAASISSLGVGVFKSISIGGSSQQFQISDNGIFSYGDSSDGTATCDGSTSVAGMSLSGGNYTMTRDVYFATLTINTGVTVNPAGYRLFCAISLVLLGTGKVGRDGNAGGNGAVGTPGSAGAALADGYLKGAPAGAIGGTGSNSGAGGTGGAGTSTSNSLGTNGTGGASGGNGSGAGGFPGGSPGSVGTATAANVRLTVGVQLATLLDVSSSGSTVKYNNSGSGSGGGGGGYDNSTGTGGGGGGSGSPAGIVAIYAKSISIATGATITAIGGLGGNGGSHTGIAGNGGGGAGANGGIIVLIFNIITLNGVVVTNFASTLASNVLVTGGVGGTGASSGSNGSAGTIYYFPLSL